jgi:hypothetical protein
MTHRTRKPRTTFSYKLLCRIGSSTDARQGAADFGLVELTGNESDDYLLGYDYAAAQERKNAPAKQWEAEENARRRARGDLELA